MPRRPASATQADIARAIRAMQDAGYRNVRVILSEGTVIVEAVSNESRAAPDPMRIIPL